MLSSKFRQATDQFEVTDVKQEELYMAGGMGGKDNSVKY